MSDERLGFDIEFDDNGSHIRATHSRSRYGNGAMRPRTRLRPSATFRPPIYSATPAHDAKLTRVSDCRRCADAIPCNVSRTDGCNRVCCGAIRRAKFSE